MRRLIADLPPWTRYVVLAAVMIGLMFVLRWIDREDPPRAEATITIHIKLAGDLQLTGAHVAPEFTRSPDVAINAADTRHHWFTLEVPARRAETTVAMLLEQPDVDEAYLEPTYALPREELPVAAHDGESCPITTPSYSEHQGYLDPAPGGIDATAAWRTNTRGAGVQFADIEGGWNAAHEDLPGDRIRHVSGTMIKDPSWRAHGTAVLGEVVGRDNGKGVVGIAPDIDRVVTSSIGGTTVANAIDAAAAELGSGDVLLIELQGTGPRGRYVPIEYWDDNFEAIQLAVSRGIVVIEAAGNGDENLDHKVFDRKFDRTKRDSGAILVGAGGPPRSGFRDRTKLDFSDYGSRVDVQGWGRKVATLDYGDLQKCSGDDRHYTDRHYTNEFSGTSSASPIVAGAAVLLESYARRTGTPLSPGRVRELLTQTGTPQTGDTTKHIGPRPDLARAFAALAN